MLYIYTYTIINSITSTLTYINTYAYTGHTKCKKLARQCKFSIFGNNYTSADLVVMNMHHVKVHRIDMPSEPRPRGQLWMIHYRESHIRSVVPTKYSGRFNATLSFSNITDVHVPYGIAEKRPLNSKFAEYKIADKDTPILWAVSHCNTASLREAYVAELARHIPVNILGPCYNTSASASTCVRGDYKCEAKEFTHYYFYLAFENSICEDYITEKVWSRMSNGLVPVVLGGGNYARDLPPHSYIDVKDFASPRLLANYLKEVIADHRKYAAYHEWRRSHVIFRHTIFCGVCEYLNRNHDKERVIADVNEVFPVSRCENVYDYYSGIFNISKSP